MAVDYSLYSLKVRSRYFPSRTQTDVFSVQGSLKMVLVVKISSKCLGFAARLMSTFFFTDHAKPEGARSLQALYILK